MNLLIPLMVIIPITCALFLNLLHERTRTVKAISIVVALALPIVPLMANYGVHYFGGYPPLAQNPTIAAGLPALITDITEYLPSCHHVCVWKFTATHDIHSWNCGSFCHIHISL